MAAHGGSGLQCLSVADRKMIDGLVKDRPDRRGPSIHWFSQTLGPGRGSKTSFPHAVAPNDVEIHLRGNPWRL